jgi:uncharacterized protein (UPF0335 family)
VLAATASPARVVPSPLSPPFIASSSLSRRVRSPYGPAVESKEHDMPDGSDISKKTKAGPISADRLKSFVERIEKLEEERKAIGGDIKDVYSEAKGVGYDVKTMRKIVSLRAMDAADRAEQETLLDVYKHALGMV